MFDIHCGLCLAKLKEPGALLFGIPQVKEGSTFTTKTHLCAECFNASRIWWNERRARFGLPPK